MFYNTIDYYKTSFKTSNIIYPPACMTCVTRRVGSPLEVHISIPSKYWREVVIAANVGAYLLCFGRLLSCSKKNFTSYVVFARAVKYCSTIHPSRPLKIIQFHFYPCVLRATEEDLECLSIVGASAYIQPDIFRKILKY